MTNPFAGSDINVPEEFRQYFDAYVQKKDGTNARPVNQPFARNIDMWLFAICIAVRKGLARAEPAGKMYKAAEGVVLNSDPWRPTAITLLAISDTNDVSVIERPGEMLKIANGYAMAGLPELLTMLNERGGDTALDYLCDEVETLLKAA